MPRLQGKYSEVVTIWQSRNESLSIGTYTKKQEKIGSNIDSQRFLRQKSIIPL